MQLPTNLHIHFFHEDKAPYPEIAAYREFFGRWASTSEGSEADIPKDVRCDDLIIWHMMGFYPRRSQARLVIHDYRSLSTGRFRRLKDFVKRAFNVRPDIRVCQNELIRDAMAFGDDRPSALIPMGVPSWIFDLRWDMADQRYDFGYVGVITKERGFRRALRSFIDTYQGTRSWLLIGPAERSLQEEFGNLPGIEFVGRLPQRDALAKLLTARCGVALLPGHPPYCWQTPTKLLEYAAMGMPILANNSPMNLETIKTHRIQATITSIDIFSSAPDAANMADNKATDLRHLDFQTVISGSDIVDLISQVLDGRNRP